MEQGPRPIPTVEAENIDPRKNIPEEHREAQDSRREREEDLTHLIHEWWRGDAHTHSTASSREGYDHVEGIYDINEIRSYYEKLGLEFVAVTEHATNPNKPEVMDEDHPISKQLLAEADAITRANQESPGIAAISGVEASILFDQEGNPTLDVPSEVANKLDLVVASRHNMNAGHEGVDYEHNLGAIRSSLLAAAEHPDVDVIGHMDRFIKMETNWDLFRKNATPDVAAFHAEKTALEAKKKAAQTDAERAAIQEQLETDYYRVIRKVIGKQELTADDLADPRLAAWRSAYLMTERTYWRNMEEVLDAMAANGKAMEINLSAQPSETLIGKAVARGIPFFLNFDAHDFNKYKWQHTELHKKGYKAKDAWAKGELTPEDEGVLRLYKMDRMSSGPGVRPLLHLVRTIRMLERLGVKPDRVVNSSKNRLTTFLTETRGKHTENLENLAGQKGPDDGQG
ncbi:MAG: hypothetical protein HY566_01865 [Candidatus Kerfeldbacteria bacterium]|nr:hypothetical protein [Candidatus Kerfeldbacteria bacterium]